MNTNSDYQNNLEKEPSDMEQEINSTRARIGRTVEELEQRLSPGQLVDQALGYARTTAARSPPTWRVRFGATRCR